MTQVITFQHNSNTFFVRAEQRDALNEALKTKELPKCEMNPFDSKFNFEEKVRTQPDDNKVYVPSNYFSKDFFVLLEQQDYRNYIRNGGAQSQSKGDNNQQDSEEDSEVKVETPIEKAEKQLAKVVEKLSKVKYVADDKESNLTTEVEKIKASFESQIKAFQDLITEDFLKQSKLLDKLGKDLPAEDIDKIYFVHSENPNINSKLSERRKEVVEFLSNRNKTSNEYKLALNFRVAKYKNEVAKFIKSYVNAHIRLIAKQNENAINEPVVDVRTKIDNTAAYKEKMANVLKLKAKRASEKLEKTRKLEKASAMKAVARAGINAVIDNCVEEARRKLNEQFNNSVVVTRTQMEVLSQKIEGFDPKSNLEHYQQLAKNVLEILETNSDFKIEPIGSNTDSNSEVTEEEVLNQTIQNVGGNSTPDMQQLWKMMMNQMGQGGLTAAHSSQTNAQTAVSKESADSSRREPAIV